MYTSPRTCSQQKVVKMVHLDQPVVPGTWLLKSREMLVA